MAKETKNSAFLTWPYPMKEALKPGNLFNRGFAKELTIRGLIAATMLIRD
jgi:hypothetical protein